MLAEMNAHLKKQGSVECVTATQLVNDKKYAKETAVGLALRTAKAESIDACSISKANAPTTCSSSSQSVHDNLPCLREMKPLVDGDDSTPANKIDFSGEIQEPLGISESTSSVESTLGQYESQATAQAPEEKKSDPASDGIQPMKTTSAARAAQGKISMGKKRVQQPHTLPVPEEEPALPWVGVRLRSVAPGKGDDTESSNNSQSEEPCMPSPWAKVKLRRVSAANEDHKGNVEGGESTQVDVEGAGQQTCSEPEIIVCPSHLSDLEDKTKAKSDEPELIECPTNLSDLDDGPTVAEEKASNQSSTEACMQENSSEAEIIGREKIDESAIVFPLKQSSSISEDKQEKVVIGKKMVMLLRSQPNQPDDRALVTWKYPREKIKALKLDMESQSVNLNLLEGGSQALSFHDSTDCLKFANAFYELLKPNDKRQADMINPSKSDDSSQHMEHLNQEEQKVLETYRQVRRNKPAGDAMRAIVHNPLLTDAEVKIAEKYRKMLKDSIPLNDVRARMQLEGVSVAVENFILSSVQGAAEHEADKCSKNLTSGTDLPLSEEERKAAEPYQKMLRLQIPPEAVQHKMTKEGIGPKIMGFVLGQAGVLAADTNYPEELSESECKIATLYSNMLKLMVPPHTVREKMKEDNVNEKIVFAVLGKDKVEKKTLEDTATKLSEAEEAIAASYRKMLKMMIPKEAVRHKMIKDQVDPKIMLVVVGGDKSAESDEVKLSDKEEAIAATYKKMLKLQLPKEAVQHRMEKEGVSEKIMKAVLGSKTSSSKKDSNTTSSTKTDNKKGGSNLVSLHWTPLSGEELDNSVWRASKKRKVTKAQPERSDISKLVELFQKKNNAKAIKAKTGDGSNSGTGKAKLLDINRANNIAISLKAFKDFSYEELAEILKNIDPNGKLKGERVLFVRDLLPTPAEVNVIKRYYGSPDRLVPAEMWFQRVAHIKRLEAKANVLRAMEVFDFEVAEIRESLQLLAQVCSQVMESERLRELLDMVLQIGNIMNEGTRTGGAAGFKFDSLLRLTQTKSADGKTTVLDYLVTIFAAKGQREVLNLTEDFPECQAASRMLITDLVANVRSIGDTLEKCKKEHQALVSELSGKVASASANYQGRNNKANQETASDTRLQLFAAIKSRGVEDPRKTTSEAPSRETSVQMKKGDILDAIKSKAADSSSKSNESKAPPVNDLLKALNKVNGSSECSVKSPRSNLLSSQNSKGSSIEANSDNSTPSHPSPLQQGVARLGKFIEEAEKNYKVLKLDCDGALNTCREMSKYCGESTGERATDTLLGILSEFVSNLEAAVKKHDRIVAAESKKQNKHQSGTPKKQRRRPEDLPVPARPSNEKLQLKEDSKEGGMNGQYAKASPRRKPSPKSKPSPESAAQTKALLPPPPPGKNGKSLVLMVNQLLKDADEQTKNDFCQGVVYEDADNTLKEIYEREKRAMARTGVPPLPTGRRGSVESDILTTIKKRQGETDANVARETRSQLERVIGCMNCTTNTTNRAESDADSVKTESSQLENSFKDLQKKWSQCKSKSSASIASVGSKRSDKNQDDEGSVHLPIDCTDFEDVVGLDQSESHGPNNLINSVVTFENGTLKSQDDDNKGSNTATSCSDESSGETKVESEPESDQK